MTYLEKLSALNARRSESTWALRIASEISFLDSLSGIESSISHSELEAAISHVLACAQEDGVITKSAALAAEGMLAHYQPVAKAYTSLCAAHAHIDMNWMWGYHETAMVTRDTFRTMLNLMEEYPQFTFSQSQASTYEIIEKFCPEMLPEIKARIHEGRWEVTASEWVEPDKNMIDGESNTRQITQSKKYLSRLLDIPAEDLCVCFLPDTFGHNANVPEILQNAGVRYMYHCRGYQTPHLYHFQAPSGKSVLAYKEHTWYNKPIDTGIFEYLPDFCQQYGVDTYLNVYGVGDHGGGPSRKDIERILTYASWPLTPSIRFGTMRQFFERMENFQQQFAVVDHDLNYLFTGCYTTQARIKMANRIAEARINEAEALMACSAIHTGDMANPDRLDFPWRSILFNHFHDILPGSGTVETREYAMGLFQEAMGHIGMAASGAAQKIVDQIDSTAIPYDPAPSDSTSEGSGAGFFQSEELKYRFPATERGRGKVRAFTLINATAFPRDDVSEVIVWDYPGDLNHIDMTDVQGNPLPFSIAETGKGYWAHQYVKLLVKIAIPAYGYTTVVLKPQECTWKYRPAKLDFERNDNDINLSPIILENELLRAEFNKKTLALTSLTDKETGKEMVQGSAACFWLSHENPSLRLTAWRLGNFMQETNLNETCDAILRSESMTSLRQSFTYEMRFGESHLRAEVSLSAGSPMLEFKLRVDWHEKPVCDQYIPHLSFRVPVAYQTTGKMACDIPYGHTERSCETFDVPCLSYMALCSQDNKLVALLTDTKYGYRGHDQLASVSLLRSPYDPDPYPDRGIHEIRAAVAVADRQALPAISAMFNHPAYALPLTRHPGKLPAGAAAMMVEGATVACIKPAENHHGVAVRVYDVTGAASQVCIKPALCPESACVTDSNENPVLTLEVQPDGSVLLPLEPFSLATVVLNYPKA